MKQNQQAKRINRKIFTRILVCFLAVNSIIVADPAIVHAATISELQQQQQQLKKEKDELQKKKAEQEAAKKAEQESLDAANSRASSIEGEMSGVEEQMEEIDEALVETIATIDLIQDDITSTKKEIKKTSADLADAEQTEQEQYNSMKERIRYMYEKGEYTYLELLITCQGFSDLMNKVEYVEKLYDYDRKLLEEYQETVETITILKNDLEDEEAELEVTLHELDEEKANLDAQLEEKQSLYDDYSRQLSKAKEEAQAYKASIKKKNAEIQKLEEESVGKQKQIDAAKKAEDEARAAAEEAKRRAEEEERRRTEGGDSSQNGSSGSGSSGSSSSGNSSSGSSSSGSSSSGSSSSGSNSSGSTGNGGAYFSPSDTSGSMGERIIQYAKQFVGNPYVYGGTSLTNGCDCSGFIYRIYKDFGYNIPRPGTSMRTIGTEVSYADARAGDIICYPGHVALYMGNGMIVHASTERTGIRISNATYKSFITIRRVL